MKLFMVLSHHVQISVTSLELLPSLWQVDKSVPDETFTLLSQKRTLLLLNCYMQNILGHSAMDERLQMGKLVTDNSWLT
jgi:hypothetical protein